MADHYLGYEVRPGEYGRLVGKYSEADFQAFLEAHEGTLPEGMVAYHYEENADVLTSTTLQAIALIPIVCVAKNGVLVLIDARKAKQQGARYAGIEDVL